MKGSEKSQEQVYCFSVDLSSLWEGHLVSGFPPHHLSVYLITLGRNLVCMSTHFILTPKCDGRHPCSFTHLFLHKRTPPLIYSYTLVQTLLTMFEPSKLTTCTSSTTFVLLLPHICAILALQKPHFFLRIPALFCAPNRSSHHHQLEIQP